MLGAKARDKAVPPTGLKKRLWDRRRRLRETSTTGPPVYERQLVPPSQRPELLRYLRQNLFKPHFFENLSDIYAGRIKRLDFHFWIDKKEHVVSVAIKNTNMPDLYPELQGKEFEEFRDRFEVHQRAVHSGKIRPKRYILRTPKVYGLIEDFLVMEFVAQTHLPENYWKEIWSELEKNLSRLKIKKQPQPWHAMPVANTNPRNPENGKWIIFGAYYYA
jgi:hypothetical protein